MRLVVSLAVICLLLIGAWLAASGGLPFMSETVSWDEDVPQADGRVLSVSRSVTHGPDEWGRSGKGRLKDQTIVFLRDGRKIEWENSDPWPITYMPEILDLVGGTPALVMPVYRFGPCHKYDFPPEGLVAFGYRDGRWQRIAVADVPGELKVNLLRDTHEVRYWDQYKGKRITQSDKQTLEQSAWGSKQGQSISEAAKFYAAVEDSCVRMRPPADRQLEEARQRNTDAERNATVIQARVLSVSLAEEVVTPQTFLRDKGQWTGAGYLTPSCRGIVERIEPARQWSGDQARHQMRLVGYELIVRTGTDTIKKIPLGDSAQLAQLESVVCDETAILAIRRRDKGDLAIHRFGHGGELLDAFRVVLPDAPDFKYGSNWPDLWMVIPDSKGTLAITMADYSYPRTANLGGTIRQKATYEASLPPR